MNEKLIVSNGRKKAMRMKKRKQDFSRKDLLSMRVSTVALWKRIVAISFGLLFCIFATWLYTVSDDIWALIIFGSLGMGLTIAGVFGGRRTLDSTLEGLDTAVSNSIVDGIVNGILNEIF